MKSSNYWIWHFKENSRHQRVDWTQKPRITAEEVNIVLSSLQAWQLGETSDGRHLIAAAEKYANKIADYEYVKAIRLFIKEEQKHGNNLGTYLDMIDKPRVDRNWADTLFRKVRYFNTSMEIWTLAVITVESTAQIFYQALKDATGCELLKQICTDILVDEAYHITFQTERLATIFGAKKNVLKTWTQSAYKLFFHAVCMLVWLANRRVFKAGGVSLSKYRLKIMFKYQKTIKRAADLSNNSKLKFDFGYKYNG